MNIGLAQSTALLPNFSLTNGAYARETLQQPQQNVIDATKLFGELQLAIGDNETSSSNGPVGDYKEQQQWFNYVLARHRAAFE